MANKTSVDRAVERLSHDPQLVAELRAMERIVTARTIDVAANGKFPHWTPDRWIGVLTFSAVLVGGIWFSGGEWKGVKADVESTRRDVTVLKDEQKENQKKLDALKLQIETIERVDEYWRRTGRGAGSWP